VPLSTLRTHANATSRPAGTPDPAPAPPSPPGDSAPGLDRADDGGPCPELATGSGGLCGDLGSWLPVLGADPGRLPADTDRSGPLDPTHATLTALTALAGSAAIRWVITDPHGHAAITSLPTHRRPSWLDHAVKTLDRRCRAPGCGVPAEHCDTDHVIAYPTGPTHPTNLTSLCRHHHRMKTHAGWTSRLLPAGIVEWTSPTGHVYTTHPGRWLPPLEPPPWLSPANPDDPCGSADPDGPDASGRSGEPPDPGDPADDPAWWTRIGAGHPPPPEACGPDTHPLLGVPYPDPPEHLLPTELPVYDPWATADPTTDDPLDQDPHDPRLHQAILS
jgi:hypothetical protein